MKKKILLCINFIIILAMFTSCTRAKDSSTSSIEKHNGLSACISSKLKQIAPKTESEQYQQAIDAVKDKCYPQAIGLLLDLGDYRDSKSLLEQLRYLINGSYIGNGIWAVGAITSDRGVWVAYNNDKIKNKYFNVEAWKNIKSISFRGGDSIEGLTTEGKIITTNTVAKEALLSSLVTSTSAMANVVESVGSWKNIKSFQTFYPQTAVALTNDGFVYAAYPYYQDGTVRLENWKSIAAVADGRGYVAGLKEDGTVVCNVYAYSGTIDTSKWKDIVAISAYTSLIGLKEDGTVVAAGQNTYGQTNVENWRDIIAIAAGEYFSIGLKADGTMVLAGNCIGSGAETPDISGMKGLYIPQISVNK